jgi:outer membrane protein TolC
VGLQAPAVVVALLTLAGAGGALAAERPLTLDAAITLALASNEDIVVEREALLSAQAAVTGARGAYDPRLAVEGGWRETTLPVSSAFSGAPPGRLAPTVETTGGSAGLVQLLPSGGTVAVRALAERASSDGVVELLSPSYSSGLGLELRQPLLRDRAVDPARFGIRVASADRERAAAGLRQTLAETVAAVERAYWTLTAARREVVVREESVRLAEEQLGETDERIQTGTAPETEAAQPRAELERRRGELLAAREAAARAENALKLLILSEADGASWGERLVPADDAEPAIEPVDVQAAMERALGARPELEAVAALVERRRAETELARDAVRPSLDAVVSYDRFGLAGRLDGASPPGVPGDVPPALSGGWDDSLELLGDGDLDDTRVGLVLAVPLGNRRARAGAAIARSAERQAEAELTRARKGVRAEVLDAAAALETAGGRIEAARAARQAAEVQLMAERERYGAGMSTNFLVLTRQNDLSSARLEEIAAQTDYRRAAIELARATGTLLAERGIAVDAADEGSPTAPGGDES